MIGRIFGIRGHFADRCDIRGLQAIRNSHFIQIGIGGKRKDSGVLVFPTKLAYPRASRRLENRNLNRLPMNHSIALRSLISRNRQEGSVIDGLDKAVP